MNFVKTDKMFQFVFTYKFLSFRENFLKTNLLKKILYIPQVAIQNKFVLILQVLKGNLLHTKCAAKSAQEVFLKVELFCKQHTIFGKVFKVPIVIFLTDLKKCKFL